MGRGKIEIKKIENVSSRQVTFSKRKTGLTKKARELSILCDAETAVIIFSNTGKLYEFASSSMNQVLSRYNKCLEASETSMTEHEAEKTNPSDVGVLEKEIAQLKQNQMRLLGKDLNGMGLNELQELEQLLNDGLFAVKDRKEQLLMHQLEQSRLKEEHVVLENMSLHKQIEEFQSYFPVGAQPVSSSLEYAQEKRNFPETNGASSPNTISISGAENVDMMTTLQLRTPALAQPERKVPEQVTAGKESRSGTSSH